MKLSTRDVEGFLRAQEYARSLAYRLAEALEPGMCEWDAYAVAREVFVREGAKRHWHLPYLGLGAGTRKLSSLPRLVGSVLVMGRTRLGPNDVAMVDIAPEHEGYPSDYTVTRVVGKRPDLEALVGFSRALAGQLVARLGEGMRPRECIRWTQAAAQRAGYGLGLPPLIQLGHRLERLPRGWPRFPESRLLYLVTRFRHPFLSARNREPLRGVWAVEPYVLGYARAAKHEELVLFDGDTLVRLNPSTAPVANF